jgi:NitT/TauT family transport system ATP-binding protein
MDIKIRIRGISKIFHTKYHYVHALRDVNLAVHHNEFVALVGASGCGKSTLLRIIGGLDNASGGQILVDGTPIHGPGRNRAMVFQDYSLYPWLTVIENIRFSRLLKEPTRNESLSDVETAVDRSYALLDLMGLEKVKDSHPNQLSGGMRQRVAIARALMSKPEILLMDEPFGALDAQTREVMHDLLLHLSEVERSTIVFVTHDVEEAIYLADRVVVLAPNPGQIDNIYNVPLPGPLDRHQDLKMAPEFLELKKLILDRIRQTSNVRADLDKLQRLTGRKEATNL